MDARSARRDLPQDRKLARRVQHERERRGMSYEALAAAVTEAGCHMNPSTPFKIEKGDPPRRITIDEFVAFATVFSLGLDELLVPPDIADDAAVAALVEQYRCVWREAGKPIQELALIAAKLEELLGGRDETEQHLRSLKLPTTSTQWWDSGLVISRLR